MHSRSSIGNVRYIFVMQDHGLASPARRASRDAPGGPV